MRATVELSSTTRRSVQRLAHQTGQSLSATLAGLVTRGIESLGELAGVATDPISGFPVVSYDEPITNAEAIELAAED